MMIDIKTIDNLRHMLSQHGEVQSLTNLPGRLSGKDPCMVLATMQSEEVAKLIHREYGFPVFGFNSLIITQAWLLQHLAD